MSTLIVIVLVIVSNVQAFNVMNRLSKPLTSAFITSKSNKFELFQPTRIFSSNDDTNINRLTRENEKVI